MVILLGNLKKTCKRAEFCTPLQYYQCQVKGGLQGKTVKVQRYFFSFSESSHRIGQNSYFSFYWFQWQNSTLISGFYVAYRWLIAIIFCIFLILSLVRNSATWDEFSKYCIYLTHWGYLLCTIQAVYGAFLVTIKYLQIQGVEHGKRIYILFFHYRKNHLLRSTLSRFLW